MPSSYNPPRPSPEEIANHEKALEGHNVGLEMGERHSLHGYDSAEFDHAAVEYGPHQTSVSVPDESKPYRMMSWPFKKEPRGFYHGYDHAYRGNGGSEKTGKRIAVLVSDSPMKIVAHVSGNQIDILHCPFCGSGAVIGRSDGTIECGFCTSVFTVQTQPQYNGMPQSVDGQPYEWPGQPDPAGVASADMPEGTNLNPNTNGEMDMQDPGMDSTFQSSDPADGGDGDDEEGGDDDKPDFLKGKGDSDSGDSKSDSKKDKKKGDNPFAKKKSYRTASGGELDEADYLAHLAILFADDKAKVAARVKQARKG